MATEDLIDIEAQVVVEPDPTESLSEGSADKGASQPSSDTFSATSDSNSANPSINQNHSSNQHNLNDLMEIKQALYASQQREALLEEQAAEFKAELDNLQHQVEEFQSERQGYEQQKVKLIAELEEAKRYILQLTSSTQIKRAPLDVIMPSESSQSVAQPVAQPVAMAQPVGSTAPQTVSDSPSETSTEPKSKPTASKAAIPAPETALPTGCKSVEPLKSQDEIETQQRQSPDRPRHDSSPLPTHLPRHAPKPLSSRRPVSPTALPKMSTETFSHLPPMSTERSLQASSRSQLSAKKSIQKTEQSRELLPPQPGQAQSKPPRNPQSHTQHPVKKQPQISAQELPKPKLSDHEIGWFD